MNTKATSLLLIAIGLLYVPIPTTAKEPGAKAKSETKNEAPKIEKQDFCVIRGYYEEITEGETKYYICRLVSTAKCVAIPCNVWGPYGPQNKLYVNVESAPPNLTLPAQGNYIVKYEKNVPVTVQIVNQIQIEETQNTIQIHYN